MTRRRRWALVAAVAATAFSPSRPARSDTPPGVWEIAEDPLERDRWNLHVKIQHVYDQPADDDMPGEIPQSVLERRLEDALAKLEEARAGASPDVRLRIDLGMVYDRLGILTERDELFHKAIGVLEPALAMARDPLEERRALEGLVDSYSHLGMTREELGVGPRYIGLLSREHVPVVALMNMGEAQMKSGQVGEALATFRDVLGRCASLPNSLDVSITYALTLWDTAIALDRSGDPRGALDAAAKARVLSWAQPGPRGQIELVTGWEAINDREITYFVPEWERDWYLALGFAAAARDERSAPAAALLWGDAEHHWTTFVDHAEADRVDQWLAIARVRRDHARAERVRAEARAHAQGHDPRGAQEHRADGEQGL